MTFQTDGLTTQELDRHLFDRTPGRIVLASREVLSLVNQALPPKDEDEEREGEVAGYAVTGYVHPQTGAIIPVVCSPEQEPGKVTLFD